MMGNGFTTREVDNLAVKGKDEAIRVYELYCAGAPSQDIVDVFGAFADGLALYRRCDWDKAAAKFNECLKAKPDDSPAKTFIARIERLKTEPPGKDWDGVWHSLEK